MTISEVIEALQKIQDEHGDLFVENAAGSLVEVDVEGVGSRKVAIVG